LHASHRIYCEDNIKPSREDAKEIEPQHERGSSQVVGCGYQIPNF